MVGEGLISEEDFWEARKRVVLEEMGRNKAKDTGLPSNILAEIEVSLGVGSVLGKDGKAWSWGLG